MVWLFAALAVYALILIGVAWFSLHPFRTPLYLSPGSIGAPQEELQVPSTDGVVMRCWWVPAESASTVAVLCHGYIMNRSELTPVAAWLWERGVSCLLLEFRAHGRTKGGSSTIGWKEAHDVAAAVAEARRRAPEARVVVIGSSMGSAASAFAAAQGTAVDALVLDSCYSRLVSASIGWWRFLGGKALSVALAPTILLAAPLARMNPFRADVAKALGGLEIPVLILHGRCDTLALPRDAVRNYEAAKPNARLEWFDDCGHSEFRWVQPGRYYDVLESFLAETGFIESRHPREHASPTPEGDHSTADREGSAR